MKKNKANSQSAWKFSRWILALTGLPLIAFTVFAAWIGIRELRAAREYEQLIEPFRQAGTPVGDAWLDRTFRERTSTDGAAAWSKILLLTSSIWDANSDKLPIVGSAELPEVIDSTHPWPENEPVADFLAEIRPIIDLIHASGDRTQPVWQPLAFDGMATLLEELQQSRSVVRLLQLDAEHALYNNDAPRAMAAIRSMLATAQAFDWKVFLVGEYVNSALRSVHSTTIQRSLAANRWNVQQIEELMSPLATPLPIAERWRSSLLSEQAMVCSVLENSSDSLPSEFSLFGFPSAKLHLMKLYAELQILPATSGFQLRRHALAYESRFASKDTRSVEGVLAGIFLPAIENYAAILERLEHERRITLTALGVKRFQLEHQRWPNELSDLATIGLTTDDWTLPEIGRIGYAVEEDTAFVWGAPPRSLEIAAARPQFEPGELSSGRTAEGFELPTIVLIK